MLLLFFIGIQKSKSVDILSREPVNDEGYQTVLEKISQWEERITRLENSILNIQVKSYQKNFFMRRLGYSGPSRRCRVLTLAKFNCR